jgi:thioredoxin reductase (NADPH)
LERKFNLIIIGAGAAGLTAGIYALRKGLKTLVISSDLGGQASTTVTVENYPGVIGQTGPQIMHNFLSQMISFGGEILYDKVSNISKNENIFLLNVGKVQYEADAVILAFGKTPKELNATGVDVLSTADLSYALVNPSEYKNLQVAIVGGGNSAVQYAIDLAAEAKNVVIINRFDNLKCEKILESKLDDLEYNVKIINKAEIFTIRKLANKIQLDIQMSDINTVLEVDKIIAAIGHLNQTGWLSELVNIDKIGQINIEPDCSTKTSGLFAAGDVTNIIYKQMVIAAAEGAKAAISAVKYIDAQKGLHTPTIDWGSIKK